MKQKESKVGIQTFSCEFLKPAKTVLTGDY